MKSLITLIKLHKKQLSSILTKINDLIAKKREKINSLLAIKDKIAAEQKNFMGTDYAIFLDSYLKSENTNRQILIADIDRLNKEEKSLTQLLDEKFSELKKFEIALENKIKIEQDNRKKTETKIMNEFNSISYNAKK